MARARKTAKPSKANAPAYPRVYEMYHDPAYDLRKDANVFSRPDCFNGVVRLRRYRITVEPIDESNDVLAERLRQLWRATSNHHHYDVLKREAKSLGIELAHNEFGAFAKRTP
jgi:hypothetical protein